MQSNRSLVYMTFRQTMTRKIKTQKWQWFDKLHRRRTVSHLIKIGIVIYVLLLTCRVYEETDKCFETQLKVSQDSVVGITTG